MKKQHKLKKKRYNQLQDVKREIEVAGIEKVKEFNGWRLTTQSNSYTIIDSTVYINGEPHGVS